MSEAHLQDADATSFDFGFEVTSFRYGSGATAVVGLTFTSIQDASKGPNGDTCDTWYLNYTLSAATGTWLIDGAQPQFGSGHTPC